MAARAQMTDTCFNPIMVWFILSNKPPKQATAEATSDLDSGKSHVSRLDGVVRLHDQLHPAEDGHAVRDARPHTAIARDMSAPGVAIGNWAILMLP